MPALIDRATDVRLVKAALRRSRVVALLGPRQCGKTTLARLLVRPQSLNYFDLEDPQSLARLEEPATALRPLKGLVVIDEVQRRPDLFPLLRVLADRRPLPARFLILGSASPDLLQQSSETLAGRLETLPLEGLRLADVGEAAQARHWLRGGFPLSFTARSEPNSLAWRRNFQQAIAPRREQQREREQDRVQMRVSPRRRRAFLNARRQLIVFIFWGAHNNVRASREARRRATQPAPRRRCSRASPAELPGSSPARTNSASARKSIK